MLRFSGRDEGDMSLSSSPEAAIENRAAFLRSVGLTLDQTISMRVKHGDRISVVSSLNCGRGARDQNDAPATDALITAAPSVALFLAAADCVPIALWDNRQRVVALVHAGWKGTHLQIVSAVVSRMNREFGCRLADIEAYLGPGIKAASFCFPDPIQRRLPGWTPYLHTTSTGEVSIDLFAYNRDQLLREGVPRTSIYESTIDTCSGRSYFSHYRAVRTGETEGRNGTLLARRETADAGMP